MVFECFIRNINVLSQCYLTPDITISGTLKKCRERDLNLRFLKWQRLHY